MSTFMSTLKNTNSTGRTSATFTHRPRLSVPPVHAIIPDHALTAKWLTLIHIPLKRSPSPLNWPAIPLDDESSSWYFNLFPYFLTLHTIFPAPWKLMLLKHAKIEIERLLKRLTGHHQVKVNLNPCFRSYNN